MSYTKVELPTIAATKIAIRPYVDADRENMGLEKYNLGLFDQVKHWEQLACLEVNGIKRYLTGLNEFAPEVKNISDKEEREAKIKFIRETVSSLEKELASNMLDPEDPQFWSKVELLRPNNDEFWGRIHLELGNEPKFLDPKNNPYDLITIIAIEAGGFSMVARSLDNARSMAVPTKFFLDKHEQSISTKNELKKFKNKAISILEELMDNNAKKLFYMVKVIDSGSPQYKSSTSMEVVYNILDEYINGKLHDKSALSASKYFINLSELSMEDLKLRALVKDATFYKVIYPKGDGVIHHTLKNVALGRNPSEVVEFLKNPLNEDVLMDIMGYVEKEWNK